MYNKERKNMRVLYIITQGEQGGGQKNVFDLATGMHELGHEVYVTVGEIENEGDKWLHSELEKVGIQQENLLVIKNLQREVKPLRDFKSLLEIYKLFKKLKPDVVHLHSSKAGVVGALASFLYNITPPGLPFKKVRKISTVYTVHGFVFLEPVNLLKKTFYIFLEFVSSLCRNFTILITELDIKVGKKFFILRNQEKYKLIYNGITEKNKGEMLERAETRKYLFEKIGLVDGRQKIVGTISNLYKTKGLEYLIDAAGKVCSVGAAEGRPQQNPLFVVLGFGDENYKKELLERVKKNNLENNFFLLGKTPGAFKYLKGFDLFTLTSVKEGLPYTLLEAKMAGLPILASRVGGIPEINKYIDMTLVETKNVKQISEKITELLDKGTIVDGTLPQVYSLENMIRETENVYKTLIK